MHTCSHTWAPSFHLRNEDACGRWQNVSRRCSLLQWQDVLPMPTSKHSGLEQLRVWVVSDREPTAQPWWLRHGPAHPYPLASPKNTHFQEIKPLRSAFLGPNCKGNTSASSTILANKHAACQHVQCCPCFFFRCVYTHVGFWHESLLTPPMSSCS